MAVIVCSLANILPICGNSGPDDEIRKGILEERLVTGVTIENLIALTVSGC